MSDLLKNGKSIFFKKVDCADYTQLINYFDKLSPETTKRFGPHKFDKQTLIDLFERSQNYNGYIAVDTLTSEIIAYSILKTGYLEHDRLRFESYGLTLHGITDYTYAPSVADAWQSLGVGSLLFDFVLSDIKSIQVKRVLLWGGVQCENHKAVNFYFKKGFNIVGVFEYYGLNYDMSLTLS